MGAPVPTTKLAEYRCRRCKHEWSEQTGPTQCPACGRLYVDWLTHEEDFAK